MCAQMITAVPISILREKFLECPICQDEYNFDGHEPRMLRGCLHVLCSQCIVRMCSGKRRETVSCPFCRQQEVIERGVDDLPIEPMRRELLEYVNAQKMLIRCKDCPAESYASSHCQSCGIFLCDGCLAAHVENTETQDHVTKTLDQLKTESLKRRSRAKPKFLKEKTERVSYVIKSLQKKKEILTTSKNTTVNEINKVFKRLISVITERKTTLLARVETEFRNNVFPIESALESAEALLGRIESARRHGADQSTIQELESARVNDLPFSRQGVTFLPTNFSHIETVVTSSGAVRTVTFTPTDAMAQNDDAFVTIEPTSLPPAPNVIVTVGSKNAAKHITSKDYPCSSRDRILVLEGSAPKKTVTITCHHMQFDQMTQSPLCSAQQDGVLKNTPQAGPPEDTGCRLKAARRCLGDRTVDVEGFQFWSVRIKAILKNEIPANSNIFESAIVPKPLEASKSQPSGLSLTLGTYMKHRGQLSLQVRYDNKILEDVPIIRNRRREEGFLVLGFLLDRNSNKVHILDLSKMKPLCCASGVDMSKPLWLLFYVGSQENTDVDMKLVSGTNIIVTNALLNLLRKLCT